MEQMINEAKRLGNALSCACCGYFRDSMLLTALLSGLCGLVLSAFRPEVGVAPFGVGCAAGVWYAGISPYFACLGALIGYASGGLYGYAAASAALACAAFVLERTFGLSRIVRLLVSFAAISSVLSVSAAIEGMPLLFVVGSSCVSILSAVILGHGVCACQQLKADRALLDSELLTLAASAGMITLSFGRMSILGMSPAMLFSGVCSLLLARRCGAASVAFAVGAAAGRAPVTGGDMYFIAVLSAAVLIASSLHGVGKTAVMLGFAGANLVFGAVMSGTSLYSFQETAVCCAIYMLLPSSLYMPDSGKAPKRTAKTSGQEARYSSLQYRISGLSEVLRGLSSVYGGDTGYLLGCVSDSLVHSVSGSSSGRARLKVDSGCAYLKKDGSTISGDSFASRMIEGGYFLCISDGMGSGEAAGRQSGETAGLACDLLSVGFDLSSACGSVNRLAAARARDDMYSTLDAMLIDLSSGEADAVKLGAAPSFVLRGGRLFTLYAENLPVGISADADAPIRRVALKRGDIIIMMSDGVYDALGNDLARVLTDRISVHDEAQAAADSILKAAARDGAADDMTVLTLKLL